MYTPPQGARTDRDLHRYGAKRPVLDNRSLRDTESVEPKPRSLEAQLGSRPSPSRTFSRGSSSFRAVQVQLEHRPRYGCARRLGRQRDEGRRVQLDGEEDHRPGETAVTDGEETDDATTGTREICDNAGNCATGGPISGFKRSKRPTSSLPSALAEVACEDVLERRLRTSSGARSSLSPINVRGARRAATTHRGSNVVPQGPLC
jgi:hypothetical protein